MNHTSKKSAYLFLVDNFSIAVFTSAKQFFSKEVAMALQLVAGQDMRDLTRGPLLYLQSQDVPTVPPFVVSEHLVESTSPDAPIQIARVCENVRLEFSTKVEPSAGPVRLKVFRQFEEAPERKIMGHLDVITFGQLLYVVGLQGKGEDGILPVNGHAFISLICDRNGIKRKMAASWHIYDPIGWCFMVLMPHDHFHFNVNQHYLSS